MIKVEEKYYKIWITLIKGLGIKKYTNLINKFKTRKNIYYAKKEDLTNIPLIDLRTIENILEEKNKILAKQCLIYMEKNNIDIISIEEKEYPINLINIYSPPICLYIRGNKNILKNKVYIGTTVQNKRSRISYKNRKIRTNPEEKWIEVENTHEPIIDKKIFDTVQKMVIVQNYNRNEKKNKFLLDGLLFCYECKHKIGVRGKKNGNYYMVCNNYRRNSKLKLCTSHGFSYYNLEETIINYIKKLFQKIDSEQIELEVKKGMTKYDYGKILQKLENEIKLINNNIDQMYVDKLNNKISEEMYERLFSKLKNEIKQKEKEYIEIKRQKEESKKDDTEKIKSVIQEFLSLNKPIPEIMKVIINRIEIHQDKQVDLYFNFKQLNNLKEKI